MLSEHPLHSAGRAESEFCRYGGDRCFGGGFKYSPRFFGTTGVDVADYSLAAFVLYHRPEFIRSEARQSRKLFASESRIDKGPV